MSYSHKSALIVGAGIGGLTTAIHLAQKGFKVKILEKNNYVGGRCSSITREGHRFDIGATLLMMTDIYKKTWESFGLNLFNELDLYRMDPIYNVHFHNGENMRFTSDLAQIQDELERIEHGSFKNFLKYMDQSYGAYKTSMKHIIDRNYYRATEFFNPQAVFLLSKLKAFKNHYKHTAAYFKNDLLRTLFTFQNIYVGQDPYKASAIFAMLPFLELTDGVWFPKGGMSQVAQNLLTIGARYGVELEYGANVSEIITTHKKATGVITADGREHKADIIIVNADLPGAYNKFLPHNKATKRVNKLKYTCSVITLHWGMKKYYPELEQHNVFVSSDYKANIQSIFNDKTLPEEPSFYLHAPSRSDKSAAPENHDTISVIVPLGHKTPGSKPDYEALKDYARKSVLQRLKNSGLKDIANNIKFEISYTPNTWETLFNISRGAVFGSLSHDLMQMGYMRPNNQHKKYRNLFFVGGSTHPGNGVPMILLSAKHTTQKILEYAK